MENGSKQQHRFWTARERSYAVPPANLANRDGEIINPGAWVSFPGKSGIRSALEETGKFIDNLRTQLGTCTRVWRST